ncbi:rod shape-determining protein MreD [Sneathiella sp.]|uniref:rod shape-determining protein MreD n=1 Tax=Sneathiella sp. TaxID=1964365 RepID=UPI002FE013DB
MTANLVYQFNRLLRGSVPFALAVLMALLAVVPTGISGFGIITPSLLTISVFYWSIHRPYLMGAPLCFLLGILFDFLTGAPLGLTSLMLLLVHGVTLSQRRIFIGKSFVLSWFGYALIALIAAIAGWLIVCLYSLSLLPLAPVLIQYALSLLIFPLLAFGFGLLQNNLLRLT